jgi:hypothetical protein
MFDSTKSNATAVISFSTPDYFACQNCIGWKDPRYCADIRAADLCAKAMLRDALHSGAVQIMLYLPGQTVGDGR